MMNFVSPGVALPRRRAIGNRLLTSIFEKEWRKFWVLHRGKARHFGHRRMVKVDSFLQDEDRETDSDNVIMVLKKFPNVHSQVAGPSKDIIPKPASPCETQWASHRDCHEFFDEQPQIMWWWFHCPAFFGIDKAYLTKDDDENELLKDSSLQTTNLNLIQKQGIQFGTMRLNLVGSLAQGS